MADCKCPQCRVRRALFGDTRPTDEERGEGVWTLALVLGDQLARFDDTSIAPVFDKIIATRTERLAELQGRQAAAGPDLGGMEVAGHG